MDTMIIEVGPEVLGPWRINWRVVIPWTDPTPLGSLAWQRQEWTLGNAPAAERLTYRTDRQGD